jgi:hypothetical protein
MSTAACGRRIAWALCVCALTAPLLAQTKQPAVKPAVLAKLGEPWPDAEAMHERRVEAERRRLFAGLDPVPLTLTADFKSINKDRRTEDKQSYEGVLVSPGENGASDTLHVNLRTRGHFRLRSTTCSFVPLRVEFAKDEARGTLFDGQKTLKLITHCRGEREYEQYPIREFLVYRSLNVLTPGSFRARLARVNYVQTGENKPLVTRLGLFLEDDDDVARRMEGRIMEMPRLLFKDVDTQKLVLDMVFEYMIGNTDFSMYMLHNIRLVRTPSRVIYTVPYDFDLSGLVNTAYAIPDRAFLIKSVRDRLYRGPCRPIEEVEAVLARFKEHQNEILALYESVPELDPNYRREAKGYLEEFFRTLDRKGDVKRTFVDGQCSSKPTM